MMQMITESARLALESKTCRMDVVGSIKQLSPDALDYVARYFRTLSEPTRLRILVALADGPKTVGDISDSVGSSMANVSRHLAQMAENGMLERETQGSSTWYRIADADVYKLCDVVCGNIARRFDRAAHTRAAFGTAPQAQDAPGS